MDAETAPEAVVRARAVIAERTAEIVARWAELCRWDPALPPDARPAGGPELIMAVVEALGRPQPIGWGVDPALADAADRLGRDAGSPDAACHQLSCLAVALDDIVTAGLPAAGAPEALRRISMIVSQMTGAAVRESVHHLRTLAFTDPLTGLPNRRAFDLDLARESSRAQRHGRRLSLAIIDVDGLKRINDRHGHTAGDSHLRAVAHALRSSLRLEDVAYRIGGDEFAVILPDTSSEDAAFLRTRLAQAGAPALSIGLATFPDEPIGVLTETADGRLYAGRASRTVRPRAG